jgi:deazaflavin-dependent oxidoreductase (nitroreductase family)
MGAGCMLGHRFLQLTHTGRATGRQYRVVVEVLRYRPSSGEAVVMAGLGARSAWLRNLKAGGLALVDFGRGPIPVGARLLASAEACTVLRDYERRMRALRPIVRAFLSRMAGMEYRGSDAELERLVTRLPLVALRPLPRAARNHEVSS